MTIIHTDDFRPVTAKVDPELLKGARAEHIVSKWHEAAPGEHEAGKRWYADAHIVAKAIAHGDAKKGAGVLSIYSPQTPWPQNLFNAARVLHEGKGIGGKGGGMMATDSQRQQADRVLAGEHYDKVLKGHKTRAFASLIHHAGMHPDDHQQHSPHVCIDRHALSVAMGRRLSDDEFQAAGLSAKSRYHEIAGHYHAAAHILSEHHGEEIPAHAVQAVTWLTQQRQNQEEDEARAHEDQLSKGRGSSFDNAVDRWKDHHMTHHPDLAGQAPTAYASLSHVLAYGETKAPEAVDTLREDTCPICGETDSYDGDTCGNCGFITPPSMFQDPDLSKAKSLDLREQQAAGDHDGGIDPNGDENGLPPVNPEDVNGDGEVDEADVEDVLDEANADAEAEGEEPIDPEDLSDDEEEENSGRIEGEVHDGDEEEQPIDPEDIEEEDEEAEHDMGGPEDPEAAEEHVNQGGEPFTKGPNAPTPEEPAEEGEQIEEDEAEADLGEGGAGYAGDGVPDLFCPACGMGADSAHPTTTPNDPAAPANAGDGAVEGDVCPNCQKATLMSGAAPGGI